MDAPTLDADAVVWSRPPEGRAGRPLLVLVHGFGGHEHDFDPFLPLLPDDYSIASVRAPFAHNRGWAWYPRVPRTSELTFSAIANRAADALLGWVRDQTGHPAVDLLGFSQGGSVAVHALRRDPAAIRAIVTLAGFRAPGRQAGDVELRAHPHRAFFGHGGLDDVIPPQDADRLEAWLRRHTLLDAHRYPELDHWMSEAQFTDVGAFLANVRED
ncbi:alpha/beta hydrolase [Lysobacter korlensis]|uniref:Alpha/beta hydrolase n=1 Tax=Lysobacter korlensis TaxID=553636 RepID=A0ABV6RWH4_9GAMM